MFSKRFLTAVAISACGIPFHFNYAHAQSPDVWTGFNAGVGGGVGKFEHSGTFSAEVLQLFAVAPPPPDSPVFFGSQGDDDRESAGSDWEGFGTIHAGYDLKVGSFVVGALADFDFYPGDPGSTTSGEVTGIAVLQQNGNQTITDIDLGPFDTEVRLDGVWSVGGRLGFLATPSLLLYGTGGYSEARVDAKAHFEFDDINIRNNFASFDQAELSVSTKDLQGYFVGGGGEYLMTDRLALRLEYRYARYNGESASASLENSSSLASPPAGELTQAGLSANIDDIEIHSVRGALVWKLGNP